MLMIGMDRHSTFLRVAQAITTPVGRGAHDDRTLGNFEGRHRKTRLRDVRSRVLMANVVEKVVLVLV